MNEREYGEFVVEQVYAKTMQNRLKWQVERDHLSAEPLKSIRVRIRFKDDGPDSAVWENAFISNPVGDGTTMITNPNGPSARYASQVGSETVRQIDEIFTRLILEPRRKQFDAALAELART